MRSCRGTRALRWRGRLGVWASRLCSGSRKSGDALSGRFTLGFHASAIEANEAHMLESCASAEQLLQMIGSMQARTRNSSFALWLWWRGSLAQCLSGAAVVVMFGWPPAVSFVLGGLAFHVGSLVSGLFALRATAPSGHAAAMAVVLGVVLKWLAVAALLLGAMLAPAAEPVWVLVGLVFAQVVFVLAAMTFKRQ